MAIERYFSVRTTDVPVMQLSWKATMLQHTATTHNEAQGFVKRHPRLLAYATQGPEDDDEARLRVLLQNFDSHFAVWHKQAKISNIFQILTIARNKRFDLIVMEGSGFAGGLAAMLARILYHIPYVFSSGDAIAPFLAGRFPLATPIFWLYERFLTANASGYVGWTPYLAGRALTMGVPRAMTAPGWPPSPASSEETAESRAVIRSKFRIPSDAIVFGIVGALNWSSRFSYCYGLELIQAAVRADSPNYVIIVGDGTGLEHLRAAAGSLLNKTIFLAGRVRRTEVAQYLAAMDIGSLPQSVNRVGSFRYSTKLCDYLASDLPFVTTQIPLSYDLDHGNLWRLPGQSPWDDLFISALSELMNEIDHTTILKKRLAGATCRAAFDQEQQILRVSEFLRDIIG